MRSAKCLTLKQCCALPSTIEDIILAWRQYLLKTGAEAEAPKHIPLFT